MPSTQINLSVDLDVKNSADQILSQLGLTVPDAIRMFLKQVVNCEGLPLATHLRELPCQCNLPAGYNPIGVSVIDQESGRDLAKEFDNPTPDNERLSQAKRRIASSAFIPAKEKDRF